MAAENGLPENEDVRKKALLRLGVAGVITAAALAGLWWLDQDNGKETPPPSAPTSPAPIVPAPPPETVPPPTEPEASASPAPAQPETAPSEQAPAPSEPPPPPRVTNGPKPAPAPSSQPSSTSAVPMPSPPAQAAPAVPRPAAIPTSSASQGFVVQLAVFSNPDNARDMVEKLNRRGIRAHLEARVQLGPFLNRQEAEKAQAEMRKLGYSALVTTAYPLNPAK